MPRVQVLERMYSVLCGTLEVKRDIPTEIASGGAQDSWIAPQLPPKSHQNSKIQNSIIIRNHFGVISYIQRYLSSFSKFYDEAFEEPKSDVDSLSKIWREKVVQEFGAPPVDIVVSSSSAPSLISDKACSTKLFMTLFLI